MLDTDAQTDHRYYRYFAPNRPFFLPLGAERVLGKPLVFSLNNCWAKYCQVDRGRRRPRRRVPPKRVVRLRLGRR
ncbi:MAG: hypothetical protein E6K55_07335 [Gemmatimonadetes bacterium]|nr:MAG: hypothetical protein DMD67_08225 [Gemmatimonadota bacterium]TLY53815.1 MAG: hypothetical protein E6K55_07335 [Gemmatimonadota bacterium]